MADLKTTEKVEYDRLFAGPNRGENINTFPVTVKSGADLKRGQLVTFADGKVSAPALKTDSIFGILVDDVNATSSDAPGIVYLNGDFNKEAVIASSSLKVDDFILACRNVGIRLR